MSCAYIKQETEVVIIDENFTPFEDSSNEPQVEFVLIDSPERIQDSHTKNSESIDINSLSAEKFHVEVYIRCDLCQKVFENRTKLINHMLIHRNATNCPICNATMKSTSLYGHMKQFHDDENPSKQNNEIKCHICFKTFKKDRFLRIHLGSHTKSFECPHCSRKFAQASKLKQHVGLVHENPGSFRCQICDKAFNLKFVLESHAKIHDVNRVKSFKCDNCEYTTDNKCHLSKHLETHQKSDKDKRKYDKGSNEETIICPICEITLKKRSMYGHMKRQHGDAPEEVQCSICSKTCISENYLMIHMRTHNKTHKCPRCNKKYSYRYQLKVHIEFDHDNPGSFMCKTCGKCYNFKKTLDTHEKSHDPNYVKLYNCDQCGLATNGKKTFEIHLQKHF